MSRKLSFEELFREANKPHSDIIDQLDAEEQQDLEMVLKAEAFLTNLTRLWSKAPAQENAQCLTESDMRQYFDVNTSDAFKRSVKQHIVDCPACFDQLTDYHQQLRAHPSLWPVLARYRINPEKVSAEDRAHIEACESCQSRVVDVVIELKPKPRQLAFVAAIEEHTLVELECNLEDDLVGVAKIWRRDRKEKPDHLVLTLDFNPTRLEPPTNLIGRKIRVNLKRIDSLAAQVRWSEPMHGMVDNKGIAQVNLGELSSPAIDPELREKLGRIVLEIATIKE